VPPSKAPPPPPRTHTLRCVLACFKGVDPLLHRTTIPERLVHNAQLSSWFVAVPCTGGLKKKLSLLVCDPTCAVNTHPPPGHHVDEHDALFAFCETWCKPISTSGTARLACWLTSTSSLHSPPFTQLKGSYILFPKATVKQNLTDCGVVRLHTWCERRVPNGGSPDNEDAPVWVRSCVRRRSGARNPRGVGAPLPG
jgi:hypothetical protein